MPVENVAEPWRVVLGVGEKISPILELKIRLAIFRRRSPVYLSNKVWLLLCAETNLKSVDR